MSKILTNVWYKGRWNEHTNRINLVVKIACKKQIQWVVKIREAQGKGLKQLLKLELEAIVKMKQTTCLRR